jgi:DNA adenine methylase
MAKPFVKWAGGKTSVLSQIISYYPKELLDGKVQTYIEPFLGGGAVLINILENYNVEHCIAIDSNSNLINCYNCIKFNLDELLVELELIKQTFLAFSNNDRPAFYYKTRDTYNTFNNDDIKQAAYFIFLNKVCFNGLYRVNSKGLFNVPFGMYKNPSIYDKENLIELNRLFQKVDFICCNYNECENYIKGNTFVYMDSPYRPLPDKNNFVSYAKESFTEEMQINLSLFCQKIDSKGALFLLSNSDPKNTSMEDTFFEKHYSNFSINRIYARRMINSDGKGRGKVSELLIKNY